MLSYVRLKNFKSFSDITFDLRGKGGIPKQLALIYGENGSGKTNLISSLLFLNKAITSMQSKVRLKMITDKLSLSESFSNEDSEMKNNWLEQFIKSQLVDLEDLIKEYKTINSKNALEIEIGFYLNGSEGSYKLSFNSFRVIFEELKYKLNKRIGTIFKISEKNIQISPTVFLDNSYAEELKENIEKYWGKHTFMSILDNETYEKTKKFIKSRIHENLSIVLEWFQKHSVLSKESLGETGKFSIPYSFLSHLNRGHVQNKGDSQLIAFEEALNTFFTSLYSDVKNVYYRMEASENGFKYELYFKKLINGKILDIPFEFESTGTQKLLKIFPQMFSAISGTSVFVDEIDSGIHDLLMCEVIEAFKEALKSSTTGQLIATTHNTMLMKQLENENVYILSSDSNGNKDIISIDNYDFRTQKNNSIQSKYLNGDYSGVPITGYLDFFELVEDVDNHLNNDNKKV